MPPQQLVELVQWYVHHGPEPGDEVNGADEMLVARLVASIDINPRDDESIALDMSYLAEDYTYVCT